MVDVLSGDAESIRIETPGDEGAEFYLQRKDSREHWQAKRQVTGQPTWSLGKLKSVLEFFFGKFRAGETGVFVSVSDAPELRMLTENALAAKMTKGGLSEFRAHFLDKKRAAQFKEVRDLVNAVSEEEAFEFLCSITVKGGRENTLEPEFGFRLEVMFQAPWQTTMAALRDLYLRSVHEILTGAEIERHLKTYGIFRRRSGGPDAVERIRDLTRAYVAGQEAKLIRGTSVRRAVADVLAAKLQNSSASLDIIVTSAAGGGKSACLSQIVKGLEAEGVPVLAFRLDRVEPVASAILLGEKLGLGESPAVVLSEAFPGQSVVLVIDQLDFVSATSGRHPDFFDTIAALRDEVVALRARSQVHLVLACRKFDFEHDHRLRRLATKDQPPVEVAEFTPEEVRAVVRSEGGDFDRLTPQQQTMLRLPQNLSLFVDAKLATTENRFTTSKELCDAYWTEKRKSVSALRPDFGKYWLPAIQRLASTMSARQELSVPARVMDEYPPEFLHSMASEGVLTWDQKRYGFGHETFFDYCFARTLPNGGRDFLRSLEDDAQHLFRRAQLRQVLAFLRDDDFGAYLGSVEGIIRSDRIRTHLKILTVELVAAHPHARDEELKTLLPWIESEMACRRAGKANPDKLASRVWDRFFSSRSLFPVADRMGLLDAWLNSGEEWLQDTMVLYLRWQVEHHGDRIAELLEPLVGKGEWGQRLRYMMEGHNLGKSRRFFELFLRLLALGTLDEARDRFAMNGTFWSMLYGLAEERPAWCAEIAAAWLDRQVERMRAAAGDDAKSLSLLNDGFGADDLFKAAQGNPTAFLEIVLPAILRAATRLSYAHTGDEEFSRDALWPARFGGEHLDIREAYLGACETALNSVGEKSPESVRPNIAQLLSHRLYTANHLLMSAYLSNPYVFAEEALRLLADQPSRLSCGYSDHAYWRSKLVIEKCSPHCSDETFARLETAVLAFTSPFERSKEGWRWRGHAAFNLASGLAESRLSASAKTRIAEWREKYKEPQAPPRGIRSYTVGSPIEEEAAKRMTDAQWLGAIAKYDSEDRHYDFDHPERGGALELARMLQKFTEEQPARFATLALQFPSNSHAYYFAHVLRGLKKSAISFESKLAVARRVFGLTQHDCMQAALGVLGSAGNTELPEDAVNYIRQAADHSDPEVELWDAEKPYYGGDILGHGINTVRGYVAEAIRDLVFASSRHLDVFAGTIEKLVSDPSLAVRACVASTLLAVARHDAALALRWSECLFDADDRLLATAYVEDLIHRGLREHLDHLIPVIQRMLRSVHEKVRKDGGTLACLARLYHERAAEVAEAALTGDDHCRLGACEVAKSNLLHGDCRAWCELALMRLFVDPSREVRQNAAGCFWHLWQSPETPLTDFEVLIRSFVASPAFSDQPAFLLHALEETRNKVPDAALDVCEAFVNRCSAEARDIRTSRAGDELTIGKLVFTAYAQLQSDALQTRALNLIDQMNLEGLNSANKHLSEFER